MWRGRQADAQALEHAFFSVGLAFLFQSLNGKDGPCRGFDGQAQGMTLAPDQGGSASQFDVTPGDEGLFHILGRAGKLEGIFQPECAQLRTCRSPHGRTLRIGILTRVCRC